MLDDPLKPGGKAPWWVERVILWVEVPTMEPWRLDGYPPDTTDQVVLAFWYGCLRTFIQLRGEVQAEEIRDKDLRERRAERDKGRSLLMESGGGDLDPDNPEDQDPDGLWDDEWEGDDEETGDLIYPNLDQDF